MKEGSPFLKVKPRKISECSLFCVFYAEFDNIVGPKVRFQTPERFMDHDIGITTNEIHHILHQNFNKMKGKSEVYQKEPEAVLVKPNSLSIFDSTCEYIITGDELAGQIISLSTHNMHIIARPTIIRNEIYERNSLLFSVGFVIRRLHDPSPFRPLLSKLASTLQTMEIESSFLSDPHTVGRMQHILNVILPSLNSTSSKCHIILDGSNVLHLQYFPPPKLHAPPVPDYAVPVLLRAEYQLQSLEWDLTIGWIVPHINGIKYARRISESSKVDAEVVRACLRVLRHHNALACVDIFRYSNVYQCTLLAQRMLAGEEESLLQEAFNFVSKQTTSGGGNSVVSGLLSRGNSLQKMIVTSGGPFPSSPVDSKKLIPPRELSSSYPPTSESLFGEKNHAGTEGTIPQPSSFNALRSSEASATDNSGSDSRSPTPSSVTLIRPTFRRKGHQALFTALAILYASCRRGLTLGEVLLSKIKESILNAEEKKINEEQDYTNEGHSSDEMRQGFDTTRVRMKGKGKKRTTSVSSPTSLVSNGLEIDWKEVFEVFDHRRFVTFGVIHGLIQRVHQYPIACDLGHNMPGRSSYVEDQSSRVEKNYEESSVRENSAQRVEQKVLRFPAMLQPQPLQAQNYYFSNAGYVRNNSVPLSSEIKDEGWNGKGSIDRQYSELKMRRLAVQIGSSMDGTKCDDELSCTYQKPLSHLIELVKKRTKMSVISIYSTSQDNT